MEITTANSSEPAPATATTGPAAYVRLARPKQWAKSAFVLIGPLYGLADHKGNLASVAVSAGVAAAVFALVSSACYIVNDVADAPRDRLHPRKRFRPIAAGTVSPAQGLAFAAGLVALATVLLFTLSGPAFWWVAALAGIYAANVVAYSLVLKRLVILDVISLAMGFVLRVLAGCGAVGVTPSTWLLNSTLFLAMFLAFGKRLGERRTMGGDAAMVRSVQSAYSDELLRMTVVVTGVATLITYAGYVQAREARMLDSLQHLGLGTGGWFNPLWLTIVPAMYGLLRAILLLERGRYDDPTELVVKDRPTLLAAVLFALMTVGIVVLGRVGAPGAG